MVRTFLVRGMLVGIVAGLLAFGLARIFGEPQIDRAIAFEEQQTRIAQQTGRTPSADRAEQPDLVSRGVQANLGFLVGVIVYSAAFGGLFALVFAFAYGRVDVFDPRMLALLLALAGFVTIVLVPALKYPANPPSVGDHETLGMRSALFVVMLAVSLGASVLGMRVRGALLRRNGVWTATLAGAGAFVLVVAAAMLLLPVVDETPDGFPASLLWRFRVAALGTQLVMWTTLGLLFGWLTRRSLPSRAA